VYLRLSRLDRAITHVFDLLWQKYHISLLKRAIFKAYKILADPLRTIKTSKRIYFNSSKKQSSAANCNSKERQGHETSSEKTICYYLHFMCFLHFSKAPQKFKIMVLNRET